MSLITKTNEFSGVAEFVTSSYDRWTWMYSVKERRYLFGFIPFKKTVAHALFAFPRYSNSPHRDGLREEMRAVKRERFAHYFG